MGLQSPPPKEVLELDAQWIKHGVHQACESLGHLQLLRGSELPGDPNKQFNLD